MTPRAGIRVALAAALVPLASLFGPWMAFAGESAGRSSADEYVLGRDLYLSLSPDNMPAAVEHLRRAVEIDPKNLRAWYTLADAYRAGVLMMRTGGEAWKKKSQATEDFLLGLSGDSGRAAAYDQRVLAEFATRLKGTIAIEAGNWGEAEAILQRTGVLVSASELSKGRDISFGAFLFSVGRIAEAKHFLARARVADRYAGVIYSHLARVHTSMNDYDGSRAVLAEGMNLFSHPEPGIEQRWHPLLRRTALFNALATGDKGLIAAAARSIKDGDLGAGELDRKLAALLDDDRALKRRLHEAWSDPVNRYGYRAESVAIWAAYARDHELAFAALHRLPNDLATWALWHPAMAEFRNMPGFREIVRKTGLLDYWRSSGMWGEFCGPADSRDFECKATRKQDG